MPAFKFKLSQPVMVPGFEGLQGRIAARTEFANQPNIYQVAWLDVLITLQSDVFTEARLLEANPPVFVAEPVASKRRAKR